MMVVPDNGVQSSSPLNSYLSSWVLVKRNGWFKVTTVIILYHRYADIIIGIQGGSLVADNRQRRLLVILRR